VASLDKEARVVTDTSPAVGQRELGKALCDLRNQASKTTPIPIQKALERLRQERETFDQKKLQDSRWFVIRMAMGVVAVLVMPALVIVCVLIIIDPHQEATIKGLAASTLLVDILGLVGTIWKVILNPASVTQLTPVTEASEDPSIYTDKGILYGTPTAGSDLDNHL
jgi:hypothetical protein